LGEAVAAAAEDAFEGAQTFSRASAAASAHLLAEVVAEEVVADVAEAWERERAFLEGSALVCAALVACMVAQSVHEAAAAAVEHDRSVRAACGAVCAQLWSDAVGAEAEAAAAREREAHYAAEAVGVWAELLAGVVAPQALAEAQAQVALAAREVPRRARSFNSAAHGLASPAPPVRPREQAWIAAMRAEARTQALEELKAEREYEEERAAVEATMARQQVEARAERAALVVWQRRTEPGRTAPRAASGDASRGGGSDDPRSQQRPPSSDEASAGGLGQQQQQQQQQRWRRLRPRSPRDDEGRFPPLSPLGASRAVAGLGGSGTATAAPGAEAAALARAEARAAARRKGESWRRFVEKAAPHDASPPPPALPTPTRQLALLDGVGGGSGATHRGGHAASALSLLRRRRMAVLHRVSACKHAAARCALALARADRATTALARAASQAAARVDKLQPLVAAANRASSANDLALGAAVAAAVAALREADGGPRATGSLSAPLPSSRLDSWSRSARRRQPPPQEQRPGGSLGRGHFLGDSRDAPGGADDGRILATGLQEQFAAALFALADAEGALRLGQVARALAKVDHEGAAGAVAEAEAALAPLGALLKEANLRAADTGGQHVEGKCASSLR
jgi:hypothetical protein